jgi:glycine cleavage system H protein
MLIEKDLSFTPTHEWVHVEGDVATVGISRFAVEQLTDLILIDLPPVGKRVEAGKSFGEVESVKAVSDLYAPVSGEVVAVNQAVVADVQKLAEDSYETGWLIKVKLEAASKPSGLLDFESYQKKVAESPH